MWAAYNGRSYSQQGRPESEQTSSNVGIDGLAPHDDAVYNKPTPKIHSPIGIPEREDKESPPPHIDTLFRSSFQSDFNLLASPFKTSSLFSQFSFTSDSSSATSSLSPPVPGSPLQQQQSQLAREADDDDEEIDMSSMSDLGLIDESMAMLTTSSSPSSAAANNGASYGSVTGSNVAGHRHNGLTGGTTSPTNMAPSPASAAASQAGVSGLQSPPTLSTLGDLRGGGEHPYGEHPSRTLFVRNIHSSVDDEELRSLFSNCGTDLSLQIRSMYTQCKHRGFVMISYFDIRDAKTAMQNLQNKVVRGRKLDIHYSIPKDNPSEKDQNQGTLVVFNLDPSTTDEELMEIFGQYGEIKEIRATPNKKHHKFIEFFDVRHAEKAMKCLNKTEIKGKKIKIEPSRPGGGVRKNAQFMHHGHTGVGSPGLGLGPQPSQHLLALPSGRPGMEGLAEVGGVDGPDSSQPARGRSTSLPAFPVAASTTTAPENAGEEAWVYHFPPIGSLHSMGPLHPPPGIYAKRSSPPIPLGGEPIWNPNNGMTNPGMAGGQLPNGADSGPYPPNGMPRYYGALPPMYQLQQRFIPAPAPGSSWRPNTANPATSLPPQRQPSAYLAENRMPAMGGMGPGAMNGMNPMGAHVPMNGALLPGMPQSAGQNPHPHQHQVHPHPHPHAQSVSPVTPGASSSAQPAGPPILSPPTLTIATVASSVAPSASGSLSSPQSYAAHQGLAPPNKQQQQQPQQSGMLVPRGPRERGITYPPVGVKKAMSPAALPTPLSYRNAASQASSGGASDSNNGAGRKVGRARSDSIDEKDGDASQFSLDIQKVNDGRERRTTLMIKNIPNKYSQKMLLAAVDEHHRGKYDFFYLPIDFKNKCNVGYAFINFIDCLSIVPFYDEFHGKKWEKFNSEKVCAITYARIQGKNSLIGHFQNSSLMCEDRKCRPIIFHSEGPHQGEQEPFPVGNNIRMRRKDNERGKVNKDNDHNKS